MKISPGVELVWGLAGRETVAAGMKEITPDHFFCGFLKLAEISDSDLAQLTPSAPVAQQLAAERDRVAAELARCLSSGTTRVRHELRRIIGKGRADAGNGPIHRSAASRLLFDQASRLAKAGAIEARLLLQELMARPTPAMTRVLGSQASPGAGSGKGGQEAALPSSHARELGPTAGEAPAWSGPQVEVLGDALGSDCPAPVLLICDPTVRPVPILAAAVGAQSSQVRLIGIDLMGWQREESDPQRLCEAVSRLLGDAATVQDRAFFLDTTVLVGAAGEKVVECLVPRIGTSGPRVLLAVRNEVFASLFSADPDLDEAFRLIWMHDLDGCHVPAEL